MARKVKNISNTNNNIKANLERPVIVKELIEQICSGEYILLVGSEIILDKNVLPYSEGDSTKYLLQNIIETQKEEGHHFMLEDNKSFMDFIITNGLNVNTVKRWALDELNNIDFKLEEVSSDLRRIISTKLFRVILTTTIDPYIEKVMEDVWGKDGYRVMNIFDSAGSKGYDFQSKDVRGNEYFDVEPTLYYIFGKLDPDKQALKFTITDDDTMEAIAKWIINPPSNLMSYLNEKKILALGCKLSDWCFRFFWYALRRNATEPEKRKIGLSPMQLGDIAFCLNTEKSEMDNNLYNYLDKSVGIHIENDSHSFINELANKLSEKELAETALKMSSLGGIFLSYSSDDYSVACNIFNRLHDEGFNIWFDNEKINTGNSYDIRIFNAIQQAKIFVPILSPNVAADLKNGIERYYQKEWSIACGENNDITIMPIILPGYDLKESYNSKLPLKMLSCSMFDWNKYSFEKFIHDIKNNLNIK